LILNSYYGPNSQTGFGFVNPRKVEQSLVDLNSFPQLTEHNSVHNCRESAKGDFMLRKHLFVLVAAAAIAIAAPFAAAQDASPNDQQAAASAQENGGWHHGPPDPARRTAELTRKLNLTSDQQAKVQEALQSERSQMESLHQDSSLSQADRRSKMMTIRQTTDSQIRSLLDSNQQKKCDEMQARREQRMQNRGSGPANGAGADQQAPPSQQ
jgi:Spy/CpxP family protein refolding chaperone